MNKIPAFLNIEDYSKIIEDNDYFTQYSNKMISKNHEANYILLKYAPTLSEFKIIESLHKDYQLSISQPFLNFYWPQNTGLFLDVLDYFDENQYKIGMRNLYWLSNKKFFQATKKTTNIHISKINKQNIQSFLNINYLEDLKASKIVANNRKLFYCHQFYSSNTLFFMAKKKNRIVGSMGLVFSDDFLEIDNLLVNEKNRNQGIASELISFAVNTAHAHNKSLILVADAEDTVKNMYENMGFKYMGYQINSKKDL